MLDDDINNFLATPEGFAAFQEICDQIDSESELLLDGKDMLTSDEFDIVFADGLTFDQKIEKLNVLRGKKPKSFKELLNKQDGHFAKAMGVRL